MPPRKLIELGMSVFELTDNRKQIALVRDYHYAMLRIGSLACDDEKAFLGMFRKDEFPGLEDADTVGSAYHRIRYAAETLPNNFIITEHRIIGALSGPSKVASIYPTQEFDPAYVVQRGLYDVARGVATVDEAAEKIEKSISHSLEVHLFQNPNPASMLEHIRAVDERIRGLSLLPPTAVADPKAVVNTLPQIAVDRFQTLAATAFPSNAPGI
jgi:hypothetical protein